MAKLDDVAESLNLKLNIKRQTPNEKGIGRKRRSWLEQDDDASPTLSTENRAHSDFDQISTNNKLVANREQSGSKVGANREQSGSKVGANREQSGSNLGRISVANWEQSGSTTGSTIGSKVVANREQSGSKVVAKITFSELVGLQREIIFFICHECKKSRSKITDALTLEHISKSLKRSPGAVKNAIGRLQKKNCLIRRGFKNGRGGWSRYEVPDDIYHDALRIETGSKVVANREQTESKVVAQPVAQPVATAPSSSSSFNNKETTTTSDLPDEWNFDIAPYARFGFTLSQIKQLASLGVITATDIEQSLIEFRYDLDNNALPPIKTTKINFLMGLLRGGHSYVSEGFKNDQEATISEMARRAAVKRESAIKAKFEAWEASVSNDQRRQIEASMPTHLMVLHRAHGISNPEVRDWLLNYYLQLGPFE